MTLKDLLPDSLPFGKKATPKENFFALDVGFKDVTASLWEVAGKHLSIENISTVSFDSADDLISASNQALDEALGAAESEPTKILFGVPDSWLQDDNLKDEYLEILKKMVKELDVSPMAYVSTTHAICHMVQKETGVPPTIILVELSDPFSVTIVKAGKIIGTKTFKRGDDLPKDIEKALLQFNGVEVLPSKIALFGSDPKGLEKYKDELTGFNWMSNLPFLHLPKVEILEDDAGIKAISLAGASEINPDVLYTPSKDSSGESRHSVVHQNIEALQNKEPLEDAGTDLIGAGFVAGDIADQVATDDELETELPESPQDLEEGEGLVEPEMEERLPARRNLEAPQEYQPELPKFAAEGLAAFKKFKLPNFKFKNGKLGKRLIIPVVIILALLAAYLLLPKAKVTIYIDPKILEKDAQVVADPTATVVNNDTKTIPGKVVEIDVSGADKGSATGKKQIGDSSKGSVIIINATDQSQSFASGTTLTSGQGLKYTLDSSVDVSSRSADFSPGKSSPVNVTAAAIGPDSNLGSGSFLQIGSADKNQVEAQASTDLAGGTSKSVTVVSADDQKKLLATVSEELRNKAQGALQGKLTGDEKVLSEGLDEKIVSTNYSKDVGDQASDFTLNLTVHYKGTAYSDGDLKLMVSKLVETNVPDGYILNLQDTETQADVSKIDPDGKLIFLARFKAKLMPKLDTSQLANEIKGKSPADAINILKGIENVIDAEVVFTPNIPAKIARMPLLPQNISIVTTSK